MAGSAGGGRRGREEEEKKKGSRDYGPTGTGDATHEQPRREGGALARCERRMEGGTLPGEGQQADGIVGEGGVRAVSRGGGIKKGKTKKITTLSQQWGGFSGGDIGGRGRRGMRKEQGRRVGKREQGEEGGGT